MATILYLRSSCTATFNYDSLVYSNLAKIVAKKKHFFAQLH